MAMAREEFEKWWRSKTPTSSETVFGAIAWAAWQAAGVIEREACAKACEEEAKDWARPSHGNAAAMMCGRRISSRGGE